MDSRRLSCAVDDEAKLKEKHQVLLQDYFVLQKECVLKKRKLKETTERKQTLLDEIRFLKRRRNLLMKKQSRKSEQQQEIVQSHIASAKYNTESNRRYMNGSASTSTSGQAFQSHRPPIVPPRNLVSGVKEDGAFAPLKLGKKVKNLITNGKRAGKRKISWQDQLVKV
ncbi:uncharacterized protein LOC141605537 [Silene latifolia]|uniref:uncharacterized protein LOC141605537 n=1 Tax=Silene latifolia TaxID=37657 RepID=UPI003D76F9F8